MCRRLIGGSDFGRLGGVASVRVIRIRHGGVMMRHRTMMRMEPVRVPGMGLRQRRQELNGDHDDHRSNHSHKLRCRHHGRFLSIGPAT